MDNCNETSPDIPKSVVEELVEIGDPSHDQIKRAFDQSKMILAKATVEHGGEWLIGKPVCLKFAVTRDGRRQNRCLYSASLRPTRASGEQIGPEVEVELDSVMILEPLDERTNYTVELDERLSHVARCIEEEALCFDRETTVGVREDESGEEGKKEKGFDPREDLTIGEFYEKIRLIKNLYQIGSPVRGYCEELDDWIEGEIVGVNTDDDTLGVDVATVREHRRTDSVYENWKVLPMSIEPVECGEDESGEDDDEEEDRSLSERARQAILIEYAKQYRYTVQARREDNGKLILGKINSGTYTAEEGHLVPTEVRVFPIARGFHYFEGSVDGSFPVDPMTVDIVDEHFDRDDISLDDNPFIPLGEEGEMEEILKQALLDSGRLVHSVRTDDGSDRFDPETIETAYDQRKTVEGVTAKGLKVRGVIESLQYSDGNLESVRLFVPNNLERSLVEGPCAAPIGPFTVEPHTVRVVKKGSGGRDDNEDG